MQVSIKTNLKTEDGDVVVHFVGSDEVGHIFWFEDDKLSYGNEHPEWLKALSFHSSHKISFDEQNEWYVVE